MKLFMRAVIVTLATVTTLAGCGTADPTSAPANFPKAVTPPAPLISTSTTSAAKSAVAATTTSSAIPTATGKPPSPTSPSPASTTTPKSTASPRATSTIPTPRTSTSASPPKGAATATGAVAAWMARRGYAYAGDCGTTSIETDAGKFCSTLYEKRVSQRIYEV